MFGQDEPGPDEEFRLQCDEDLRLHFAAVSRFAKGEERTAKAILEAFILEHQPRPRASAY